MEGDGAVLMKLSDVTKRKYNIIVDYWDFPMAVIGCELI